MSDQEIQSLEDQFPADSGSAFAAAREQVLASGHAILASENGVIYRIYPDGRREVVKRVEPPTAVIAGTQFKLA